jgi:hypothetical protein
MDQYILTATLDQGRIVHLRLLCLSLPHRNSNRLPADSLGMSIYPEAALSGWYPSWYTKEERAFE